MSCHLQSVTLLAQTYPTGEHYPFTLPVLRQTKRLSFDTPVTLFVGENGSGKSTLLEAIVRACDIHIWQRPDGERYQRNPYEHELYRHLELEWTNGSVPGGFFGSDTFHDFSRILDGWAAANPDFLDYYGGKSLVTQSHGQSMMSYFRARYGITGLYLMDEPETALSPKSQLELLEVIQQNSQAGHAQFIIATHSPILLSCQDATIYSFDNIPVRSVAYKETDHYRIYRDFMADQAQRH